MKKKELLNILRETLSYMEREKVVYHKAELSDIIDKYKKTILGIEIDALAYNEIHNSVKAYLEIYNDYDNPLLYQMSDAEEAVENYLSL
ncbi:hypothetical protein [Tatumella sp. OPLPL6]|uniref:hypothetical protein n=1 Tax=Tatumella sp. OPLPL6 TaxID=1928657 RepID=UPI000C18CD43|nr:hypothetical protein [Tatumella sp. OPLPL6]PIJ46461.1 hypothetical protein BOM24_01440 [Tatumella sp. OPLPL6]